MARISDSLGNGVHVKIALRLIACCIVVAGAAWFPATANAQSSAEHINSYAIKIDISQAGVLSIDETIDYDFGSLAKHGIFRDIPYRARYNDKNDRVYNIDNVTVSASPNTPADFAIETEGNLERIRIGSANETITGQHTYVIHYDVVGALNAFGDHDELYWNAIGPYWAVPISSASATVTAPGQIQKVTCFAGASQSKSACSSGSSAGNQATFEQQGLSPYEAFTIVVALPKGAVVPAPTPILEEHRTIASAFAITPITIALTAGVTVILAALITLVAWRKGRGRRFVGSGTDVAFGSEGGKDKPIGLFDKQLIPVEFVPPDGIKPAEAQTLITKKKQTLSVTATIIDLAVRGYLLIQEVPKQTKYEKQDWQLTHAKAYEEGVEYESTLMHGLFATSPTVLLSSLHMKFRARLTQVLTTIFNDVVAKAWFRGRPDHSKQAWFGIGCGILIVGILATLGTAVASSFGLVPVPIILAGITVMILSTGMPGRTAKGTAMYYRTLGFKRLIDNAEAEKARWAERANVFSEYLPYAIVFGCTAKWAKAFAGLATEDQVSSWYQSSGAGFNLIAFAIVMNSFSASTATTLAASPASAFTGSPGFSGGSGFGGGGFSGGGGGGGGGGSW